MLRALAVAGAMLAGIALPSLAEAAYTTGSVNLRTGPGTNYPVIVTAPPGAWVAVRSCLPAWCNVTYGNFNGWMSAGLVGGGPAPYPGPAPYYPPPPPPPVVVAPYPYPYPYYPYRPYRPYRPYGPYYNFSFGFGGHYH